MRVAKKIQWIKDVAKDFGHTITDLEAAHAHDLICEGLEDREDYYYDLKDYFKN